MFQYLITQNCILPVIILIVMSVGICLIWKKVKNKNERKRNEYYARIKKCEDEHRRRIYEKQMGRY